MKKALLCIMFAVAGLAQAGTKAAKNPVVAPAPADDTLGFSLSAGYDSDYIFRGYPWGNHLVWAGLSMPIKLTDKLTFTFAPWYGNVNDADTSVGSYDELDLVASLSYDAGFATISAGYTWYYYPFSDWNTSEPNITISKTIGNLTVFGGAYLDVNAKGGDIVSATDGSSGWYFEAGANYNIKICDKLSLVPEVRLSYGENYYGVKGFNNVTVKLTAPYQLTKTAVIAPYIAGNLPIDSLKDDLGVDSQVYGGVALTVTF